MRHGARLSTLKQFSSALVLMLGLSLICADSAAALSSFTAVKDGYRASDIRVLDRSGQLLQRVRSDYQGRRADWISLDDISPALQKAVVLSEDHRFYSHAGIDWRGVAGAAWANLFHESTRGASTLSMQVVGFIDPEFRRGPSGRSIFQKIDQAIAATQLEAQWTKSQILEAYLNLASFRGELVGVGALSRVMFQKHASGLNAREAALAAALLPSPNASRRVLAKRACRNLRGMGRPDQCQGLGDFIYLSLLNKSAPRADSDSFAPHFARWVLSRFPRKAGQAVTTSIDGRLQAAVLDMVERHLFALRLANVRDAAVVVLDNQTGQVLAYVGSSGQFSSAGQVDHARALRQAGSTLKPFLYAQAIEQQRLTTVSLLNDGPLNLSTGSGLYIPQNYDKHFAGWVSVRTALASSLNIPAVRTLVTVTPDAFQQRLVQLGLPLDRSGDFYGYSLALGSADVTLLTLTNAYRALANLGRFEPPRVLAQPETPRSVGQAADSFGTPPSAAQVMSPGAAWIVGDILSDRHARARTFGLDSPLTTPFWTAVKTGTSKDMRDNWCVGWSERYTVGVWVGNSGGASMRDVSGVSGAGPIWQDVMSALHAKHSSVQPPMPKAVSRQSVVFDQRIEPARSDVFLGDTAVSRVRLSGELLTAGKGAPRIITPVSGTILAVDPDIPAANQRTWFRADNLAGAAASQVSWRVDAETIGRGSELAWMPWPGQHKVELVDEQGRILDRAMIEVRGAALVH